MASDREDRVGGPETEQVGPPTGERRLPDDEEREDLIQPKAAAGGPSAAAATAGTGVAGVRPGEGGRSLDAATRGFFEDRFGRDFGDVRVHDDARADVAARSLGAEAFTYGQDVFFRSGRYRPDRPAGRRLLAHELTHTLQQRSAEGPGATRSDSTVHRRTAGGAGAGGTSPPTRVTSPGETIEQRAAVAATRVASGHDVRGMALGAANAPVVARQVAGGDATGATAPTPGDRASAAANAPPSMPAPGAAVQLQGQPTFQPTEELDGQFGAPTAEAESEAGGGTQRGRGRRGGRRRSPDPPVDVPVVFGELAGGTIRVTRTDDGEYETPATQAVPLTHPLLAPLRDAGVSPVLALEIERSQVSGYITVGDVTAEDVAAAGELLETIQDNPTAMGWVGLDDLEFPTVTNELTGGTLTLQVSDFAFRLGGYLEGTGSFGLTNESPTFAAEATVDVPRLTRARLTIERDDRGQLYGSATVPVELANFQGTLDAEYGNGTVAIEGTVEYAAEKFGGSLTLLVTDRETARNIGRDQLGSDLFRQEEPSAEGAGGAPEAPARGPAPGPRAVAGHGTVDVHLTEWLAGQAQVVVDNEGEITVVGEIRPPAEVELFEQTDFIHEFPRVEVRTLYGVPLVGNVFLFANVGLDAMAKLGPAKIYDIVIQGQYSTDPDFFQNFRIAATLNVSAFAGLRLRGEGGAGVELVDHDIKAGVGVNALAGIRGYAEATPSIGYREQADPEAGKIGEFYILGHMEIAAQPFLGLGGDLFVELDSPFWSPAPDETWTWPLGELEYPLPGEFGIGADFDYVIGSGEVPNVEFGEVDFDSSKFMSDLMNDNVRRSNNAEQETTGEFEDRSSGGAAELDGEGGGGEVASDPALTGEGDGSATNEPASGQQDGEGDVPQPAVEDEWLAGMEALGGLAERSSSRPYDAFTLGPELAEIERRYGFTAFDVSASSGEWEVDAALNPEGEVDIYRVRDSWTALLAEMQADSRWDRLTGRVDDEADAGLTLAEVEAFFTQYAGVAMNVETMRGGGLSVSVGSRGDAVREVVELIRDDGLRYAFEERASELIQVERKPTVTRVEVEVDNTEVLRHFGQGFIDNTVMAGQIGFLDKQTGEFRRYLEYERIPRRGRRRGQAVKGRFAGIQSAEQQPEAPSSVEIVFTNTGGRTSSDDVRNVTHAEHNLQQAVENWHPDVRSSIRRFSIDMNWSPCTLCTADLIRLRSKLPSGADTRIEFATVYQNTGKNQDISTTQDDIETLQSGWSVSGPPILTLTGGDRYILEDPGE
jgi:hypothetical protein